MEPVIAFNMLRSIQFLTNALNTLSGKCVNGITANEEHCRDMVYNSIGIVTAVNPYLGYQESSRIAKQALANNDSVIDIIRREKLMDEDLLNQVLKPENMTSPRKSE